MAFFLWTQSLSAKLRATREVSFNTQLTASQGRHSQIPEKSVQNKKKPSAHTYKKNRKSCLVQLSSCVFDQTAIILILKKKKNLYVMTANNRIQKHLWGAQKQQHLQWTEQKASLCTDLELSILTACMDYKPEKQEQNHIWTFQLQQLKLTKHLNIRSLWDWIKHSNVNCGTTSGCIRQQYQNTVIP